MFLRCLKRRDIRQLTGSAARAVHSCPQPMSDTSIAMSAADTAWMLVATAMVLLMTPALAFFYGGMVRAKNTLNTMMMSFAALGFVGLAWALVGYALAFGESNGGIVGGLGNALLRGVDAS